MQHDEFESMGYLTDQCLPTALYHLRDVGCDSIDSFTLALTAWPGEPVEDLQPADRQQFQGLHLAACKLLGVKSHAPDLRRPGDRDDAALDRLADAYRWAGKAQVNHAEALREYVNTRRENPTDRP